MRAFAMICVVLGILISLVSPIFIHTNQQAKQEACFQAALRGGGANAYCFEAPPNPLTGVLYGLPVLAFGILILAIRPAVNKPATPAC